MASYADIWGQVTDVVAIYDDLRLEGAGSLVTLAATHVAGLDGVESPKAAASVLATRSAYARAMASLKAATDAHFADLAGAIGSDDRSAGPRFFDDLARYMDTNTSSLNSRNLTQGSVTAGGSNVGTGTIYHLTKDKYDFPLEAVSIATIVARCNQDRQTGTQPGREVFQLSYSGTATDALDATGGKPGGGTASIAGVAGDQAVANASFQSFSGTTSAPTEITSWTSSVTVNGTNYAFDSSNYFRSSPEEVSLGTSYSLKMLVTATLTQKLRNTRLRNLDRSRPYCVLLRYNREVNSATGTLVLSFGAATVSVVLAAQAGWQTLVIAMADDLWPDVFESNDMALTIDWTRTGGTGLLVDDVVVGPMTPFDGTYWFVAGGATPFKVEDTFTQARSLAGSEAKVQRYLRDVYNVSLPTNNAGSETITDP